jgi:hypothetical protein
MTAPAALLGAMLVGNPIKIRSEARRIEAVISATKFFPVFHPNPRRTEDFPGVRA